MLKAALKKSALDEEVKRSQLFTTEGVDRLLKELGIPNVFKYENDLDHGEVINFTRTSDAHFHQGICQGLQNVAGHSQVSYMRGVYPLDFLAKHYTAWCGHVAQFGYYDADHTDEDGNVSQAHPNMVALKRLLDTRLAQVEEAARRQIELGEVTFDTLPFYFRRGLEVVFTDGNGQFIAGDVEHSEMKSSFFGSYIQVMVNIIHGVQGTLMPGKYSATIPEYNGVKKLDELAIRPIDAETKKMLTERGRIYVNSVTKPTYLSYKGNLTRSQWWSTETFRADGRVMVDVVSFQRVDSDQFQQEMNRTGIAGMGRYDREEHKVITSYQPKESDLWKSYPYVWGFSFRAKRWGKMTVADISPISWRDKSFDQLVLDADQKKMVRALVEHNDGSFSDIIEGKGGGCIFLLHGPPGQGKTLTAETIAELLKRPLYAISVGELGVTPDQLEERLRVILDVATVWNAVILLDEADIYLEARDEHDIMRNAMVGVFLRLLEYHHGVLFLTTNRVKNIDNAFYSRISVALHFGEGDADKRVKIWENLLDGAGLKKIDAKRLAGHEINGRQIKNAIRLSQTLAKAENKEVDTASLERVIKLMTAFDRERSGGSV